VTQVKVCGVNSDAAFDAVVEAGADWLGFVFFERSPRNVSPSRAAALSARHAGGPLRVGLFVEPTDDAIATVLDTVSLDVLQLHATPARALQVRQRFGRPVWRAIGVSERIDLPESAEGTDALLIEAKPPAGATRPGGNARSFDWLLLRGWQPGYPWLLAGGLAPHNVAQAIRTSGAAAVDASSGLESSLGVKDSALIRAFVANARAA
jgi:phosphoribosylanthranilate isomerase